MALYSCTYPPVQSTRSWTSVATIRQFYSMHYSRKIPLWKHYRSRAISPWETEIYPGIKSRSWFISCNKRQITFGEIPQRKQDMIHQGMFRSPRCLFTFGFCCADWTDHMPCILWNILRRRATTNDFRVFGHNSFEIFHTTWLNFRVHHCLVTTQRAHCWELKAFHCSWAFSGSSKWPKTYRWRCWRIHTACSASLRLF